MEEIKINPNKLINGEYVRTNRGTFDRYITKHKDSSNDFSWYTFENRGNITNPENYVVKHSPNIIDLIEEGNIVEVLDNWSGNKQIIYIYDDRDISELKLDIKNGFLKLLSIVTKEQFNSIKYVLEE